jgi:hypothetical protein
MIHHHLDAHGSYYEWNEIPGFVMDEIDEFTNEFKKDDMFTSSCD